MKTFKLELDVKHSTLLSEDTNRTTDEGRLYTPEDKEEQVEAIRDQRGQSDRWHRGKGKRPETRAGLPFKIKQEVTRQTLTVAGTVSQWTGKVGSAV